MSVVILFAFRFIFKLLLLIGTAALIGFSGAYLYLSPKLDDVNELKNVQFQVPLRIYTSDLKLIAEYGEKKRIPLDYAAFPPKLIEAFVSAEDDQFFHHHGVDIKGLLRAVITLARTGERKQGGSTITMQVARNFYLTRKKTYLRKLNEIFLSFKIERELRKEDIMALYLNKIYFGHRAYGVAAAAQVYYGKELGELSLSEYAMLAGLPKAPSAYNPIANPPRALIRRNYVLRRMQELGYINQQEYNNAIAEPDTASVHGQNIEADAPYVAEMVRAYMVETYGDDAMTGGYQVVTTINSLLQNTARSALRDNLLAYEHRHGYRGSEKHFADINKDTPQAVLDSKLTDIPVVGDLLPGIVTDLQDDKASVYLGKGKTISLTSEGMRWAKKSPSSNASSTLTTGDLIRLKRITLAQNTGNRWELAIVPDVSGAFVCLDPNNGALQALVGGFDFNYSKFNRAEQAKRQPGSGFKPFVYTAAIDKGYTAATLINDAPITHDAGEEIWRPENYGHKTYGPTRLRVGLRESRNLISIRLLRDIGIDYARNFVTRFGFPLERIPNNLSLVLGTGTFTPLEMATAYMAMANGGYKMDYYFVEQINDGRGQKIYRHQPMLVCPDEGCEPIVQQDATSSSAGNSTGQSEPVTPIAAQRIITPQVHYIMHSILQDVVQSGTAQRAKVLNRDDLAGKTGTTNDQKDAWFYGFNRRYVGVAWVGFDNVKPLGAGETGGKAALPMWVDFMRVALKDVPQTPFPRPNGIVSVRIDANTGMLTSAKNPNSLFEIFREDNAPTQMIEPRVQPDGTTPPELF